MSTRTPLTLMLTLLVTAACGAGPSTPETLSQDDVAALRKIADEDARVVLARDWEALASRFAPDAVRMPPNGPSIQGRDAIRRYLESLPPIQAFDFKMVDLKGDGRVAYMRATWSITVAPPGTATASDSGKILIVFEKQPDGSWLTVADAWNSDNPVTN